MDEDAIKAWLLNYAWLGDADYQRREVDCIMAQDDWRYIDARIEMYKGQASGEEVNLDMEASGFALSGLYECHDEPHLPTCPHFKRTVVEPYEQGI